MPVCFVKHKMLCLPVYKDVYKLWITWAKLSVSRCDALCITRIKNNKNIAQNSQKVGGCAFINNLAFIYKNQGKLRYKNYCLITLIILITFDNYSKSFSCWLDSGGFNSKYCQAWRVAIRPRGVRIKNPC